MDRQNRLEALKSLYFNHVPVAGGRITMATVRDQDTVYYSFSFCSPNRNFDRRLGRLLATNRLSRLLRGDFSQDLYVGSLPLASVPSGSTAFKVKHAMADYLGRHGTLPRWLSISDFQGLQ